MTPSRTESETPLLLLKEIRRQQGRAIDTMANDWREFLRFEVDLGNLVEAVTAFGTTLPAEPTSEQATTVRRDLLEFRDELSALKYRLEKLGNVARDVQEYMIEIKKTLDVLQSRYEDSDVRG